jgi:hypothetical protein
MMSRLLQRPWWIDYRKQDLFTTEAPRSHRRSKTYLRITLLLYALRAAVADNSSFRATTQASPA